jgi:hypothetical protein
LPQVADSPSLLERESLLGLCNEIESREPEGSQDSTTTLQVKMELVAPPQDEHPPFSVDCDNG